ncbi:GIY-YIG nuclease family protein [archaeon]|jgi:hypothetical protein|nr:GIY-YIG nuclease family protein [archaeon]
MKTEYIDRLIADSEIAKKTVPICEFKLKNLDSLDKIYQAIYIIEEIGGDKHQTSADFSRYKEKKDRSCPKDNKAPSSVMYVGPSTTNIRKRIEQYKGDGHPKTYALHLKHWFKGNYKITIKEYQKDLDKGILQIIEDNLSYNLKPAFGKKGGNNK